VSAVGVGSVAAAFALALVCFGTLVGSEPASRTLTHDVYEWFSVTVNGVEVPIRVRFVMDELSGLMTVMVTGIAMLIHIYSTGYMAEDPGYARFMTYLNLFTASMLVLVLASNLPLMFVGWEGVGLCSYLLIGFWYQNRDYAAAGRKAFVVNRIGDFGVLIGMFLIVSTLAGGQTTDVFEFSTINSSAVGLATSRVFQDPTWPSITIATAAALFIFLGCTGKSAQIPLFVWLPDAMAGPTPVSALIHAATMVTAGVYLCCRLSPVIAESQTAMAVIAIVGALTAILAASIALVQNQMKKILAYSTVSQLGFMFAAVGMGAFAGGIFHVFTHAFFKACLFLGAGSVMHAVHAHGDADIRYLGGLKKYLPHTRWTFLIACIAIAGLPFFSGFFSKDEILLGAATWASMAPSTTWAGPWVGWFVLITLVIAATLTAFYMFRLYFGTFEGDFKGGHAPEEHGHDAHDEHEHVKPHESPESMTIPLWVLAAGSIVVGYLGMPHLLGLPNLWTDWMAPRQEVYAEAMHESAHVEGAEPIDEAARMRDATRRAREEHGLAMLQFDYGDAHNPDVRMVEAPAWAAGTAMGLGTLAALLGSILAFVFYYQGRGRVPKQVMESVPALHRFLMDKWRVDELYGVTIVPLMKWLAVLAGNIDTYVVDGLLTKATSALARGLGYLLTRLQTGAVYAYTAIFIVGFAGMAWWYTFPHAALEARTRTGDPQADEGAPAAGEVTWTASRGLGYRYRWDLDNNGTWDTDLVQSPSVTQSYTGAGDCGGSPCAYYSLAAIVETQGFQSEVLELVVEQGDPVELPIEALMVLPESGALPVLEYGEGALLVHSNGTNVEGGTLVPRTEQQPIEGLYRVARGESVRIGGARVTVAVRIAARVEVQNGFGNLSHDTAEVTVRVPPQAQAALDPALEPRHAALGARGE
ncbi:MAG: NADH-quinone oxidoreductase subunit L, partial [Sandaracinaceae bacterium]|nr:NADH-quinone oxidoreductase subunit L [Sandaracinaceae bacterium]